MVEILPEDDLGCVTLHEAAREWEVPEGECLCVEAKCKPCAGVTIERTTAAIS